MTRLFEHFRQQDDEDYDHYLGYSLRRITRAFHAEKNGFDGSDMYNSDIPLLKWDVETDATEHGESPWWWPAWTREDVKA